MEGENIENKKVVENDEVNKIEPEQIIQKSDPKLQELSRAGKMLKSEVEFQLMKQRGFKIEDLKDNQFLNEIVADMEENHYVTVWTRFGYADIFLAQFDDEKVDISEKDESPQDPLVSEEVGEKVEINEKQEKIDQVKGLTVEDVSKQIQDRLDGLSTRYQNALSKMCNLQLVKGGELFTQRRELKTHITINVKTFHGSKKTHQIKVSILDKIQVLVDQLRKLEPEEINQYYGMQLVYPMGVLRNLSDCIDDTFLDQLIPDQARLVLVGQQCFTWNIAAKGPNINLSNNNCTANKKSEIEYETVLGTVAMSAGTHYWEIKIEKFVDLDDILLGVSKKDIDIRSRLFDTGKFYGWICTGGRKIYPTQPGGQPKMLEYGGCAKIGDTIGCILEFKNTIGTLSFLKNGSPLGICCQNIPPGSYLPTAALYYGEVQITLDSKARLKGYNFSKK